MPGVDIKKDDTVRVISGKDRGREGRGMGDGAALAKKHQRSSGKRARGSSQQLQQGGIIDAEMFVNISNVQVVCSACGKPTRIGHRIEGDRKVRFCRKCETELS